jgi:hypothetical protein
MHTHTHTHTHTHLANPIDETFGPTGLGLNNKDELPLDNRVIGTLVSSFFEYSYAPASFITHKTRLFF